MICYKGKVLTVDSNDTVAGYLVEDKGRIVYVGNELPEQYKNVQTVELGKKVLVPAFVDTHQHMASFLHFTQDLMLWMQSLMKRLHRWLKNSCSQAVIKDTYSIRCVTIFS